MLDLNSVMVGSANPEPLAKFYEKVFKRKPDWAEGEWYGWQAGSSYLHIGPHSEVKGKAKEPQRIILDFQTRTVKAEFERIKGLGAQVITEPYEMDGSKIATLADPDGNYFQLMSPWK
jgi:predicted enzyme related to lactoylglutathione lyase